MPLAQPAMMLIVPGFCVAWLVASAGVVLVAAPTTVPAPARIAVRMTAVPVAVSQPKNAEPHLIPP